MTEFDRGTLQMERGEIAKALSHFEAFVTDHPDSVEGRLFHAICLAQLRRISEARQEFDRIIELDPDCCDALTWSAELALQVGEHVQAFGSARRACELEPNRADAWCVFGRSCLRVGEADLAVDALKKATELAPGNAQNHHLLALAYGQQQRHDLAVEQFRLAIELAPRIPQSYLALASSYTRFGLAGKALDILKTGLSKLPLDAALHTAAATAFTQIRNDQAAESHHRKATELSPDARIAYALWLVDQGRYRDALQLYETLIAENKRNGAAYYGVLQCRKLEGDDPLLEEMESLMSDPSVSPVNKMYVCYAAGKAREQRNEFESAMTRYDEANRLAYRSLLSTGRFHAPSLQADSNRVIRCYEELRNAQAVGIKGPAPIFIIGMIRSGTTLLDQVVSSHPEVSNAGELRYWIEKSHWLAMHEDGNADNKLLELAQQYLQYIETLVTSKGRTTDKMPLNFFYAGIIQRALPDARFIHIRRHPVDTCLSIYTTYFGNGSQFVYNRANTVAYYREYQRVMAYWRSNLPKDRLLEIDYEDLIGNRECVIRKVIAFCDLPWNDACLHHEDNKSAINTPSRWQARQPMYKTSIERWRKFEPWLGEFAELLA